jgi:hypothetical protein
VPISRGYFLGSIGGCGAEPGVETGVGGTGRGGG